MRGQDTPKIADMRLFRHLAPDGRSRRSFGTLTDFGETMTNAVGNATAFDVDPGARCS